MRRADDLKGILNLIILVVVAAGSLLGPLLERWRKKREAQKGIEAAPPAAEPEPAVEEAKLPYEHLVDEVFGPYMQRRRQAFAERQAAAARVEEPEPEPEPPAPAALVPEEPVHVLKIEAPPAPPPPRTLEQRLFGGRALTPAARWVLSAEILQPPKALRRRP